MTQNDILRAESLLMVRQYEQAYPLFQQLHRDLPEDGRVTEGFVRTLMPMRRWAELEGLIIEERERRSSAVLYGRELALACRALGRPEVALEEVLVTWVASPGDAQLRMIADTLLMEANYSGGALAVVRNVARKAPRHAELRMLLMDALMLSGQGGEACREALAFDRETNGAGRTLLEIARRAATARPEESLRAAETAIREFPNTPTSREARVVRAGVLRDTPRWSEARKDLEALAAEPAAGAAGVSAQALLAEADLARDPEAARARARALAERHPEAAEAAAWIEGGSYYHQRRFAEACAAYWRVAVTTRDLEARKRALWSRAESFFFATEWDSATAAYRMVAGLFLRDPRADEALARMLLIADATEEGDSALRAFAGAAYEATLNPAAAESLFAGIHARHPREVAGLEALYQRAELRRRKGDLPGALTFYAVFTDTALKSPRAQEALFTAAEICRVNTRDSRRALSLYSDVAARFPDSWLAPDARKWVEKLCRELGS
ncbi:MAG: tetratricopeptide repeat protein [Candidatus Eisenbacteria bacterium]|nr:tetratricopeptide repeat protein [Candidatus Eisenbacteria bacterium]